MDRDKDSSDSYQLYPSLLAFLDLLLFNATTVIDSVQPDSFHILVSF